jgi:hypothetical protein
VHEDGLPFRVGREGEEAPQVLVLGMPTLNECARSEAGRRDGLASPWNARGSQPPSRRATQFLGVPHALAARRGRGLGHLVEVGQSGALRGTRRGRRGVDAPARISARRPAPRHAPAGGRHTQAQGPGLPAGASAFCAPSRRRRV